MNAFVLKFRDLRFPLRFGETLIGRSPYCSVVLTDPLVSRQHATFQATNGGLSIRDLASHNGTLVNGEAIHGPCELRPGDVIEVGHQRLEVEHGWPEESQTASLSSTAEDKPGPTFAPPVSDTATHA